LAGYNKTSGEVCESDGRVSSIDRLATRT